MAVAIDPRDELIDCNFALDEAEQQSPVDALLENSLELIVAVVDDLIEVPLPQLLGNLLHDGLRLDQPDVLQVVDFLYQVGFFVEHHFDQRVHHLVLFLLKLALSLFRDPLQEQLSEHVLVLLIDRRISQRFPAIGLLDLQVLLNHFLCLLLHLLTVLPLLLNVLLHFLEHILVALSQLLARHFLVIVIEPRVQIVLAEALPRDFGALRFVVLLRDALLEQRQLVQIEVLPLPAQVNPICFVVPIELDPVVVGDVLHALLPLLELLEQVLDLLTVFDDLRVIVHRILNLNL